MADPLQTINSLVVPLNGQNLLLPQSAMAEVLSRQPLRPFEGPVKWLRGFAEWRGQQIPVVSLETICGRSGGEVTANSRFVVLYAVEGIPGLQFYALEVSGIPHPVKLQAGDLVEGGVKDQDCEVVARNVLADGESCVIPDLQRLEYLIRAQMERL
ncbi:MAG: chemotaxis protein CheW [Chromatiales bacterium]|nr:chemotaxis protein CheW [Chromatiales bacterium]